MQSFLGRRATLYNPTPIHPVLNSLADECCGMLAHPVAYVGALALLAIVGIHLWDQLPAGEAAGASAKSLERGHALASGVCRQSVRFCPKNRDLRDPPAPRERPQGHLARGRRGRKARPKAGRRAQKPAAAAVNPDSSNISTNPICRSPAGLARATARRPAAPRSAAFRAG